MAVKLFSQVNHRERVGNRSPRVSVVIPAFNEAKRIRQTIQSLSQLPPDCFEILIVIEKSTDHTVTIAREAAESDPRVRILSLSSHVGKGFAVRAGMLAAEGDYIFFMDADLSTPLFEIQKFVHYFDSHPEAQILIGNRRHLETQILRRQHPLRQHMGRIFNSLVQRLVLKGIEDTQCGFKGFRQPIAHRLFAAQTITGFAFDVEILTLAKMENSPIVSLPVSWTHFRDSKVRIVFDSLLMAFDILRIRQRLKIGTALDVPSVNAGRPDKLVS